MEDGVGRTFDGDGGCGGQHGWAFAMCVFSGVKCRNKCCAQPTVSDSDKEKWKEVSPP